MKILKLYRNRKPTSPVSIFTPMNPKLIHFLSRNQKIDLPNILCRKILKQPPKPIVSRAVSIQIISQFVYILISDKKDKLYKSRDKAITELKELARPKAAMSNEQIKKEIIALAKDLPTEGRITYGSKDMEVFKPRIDKIVQMLLATEERARKANRKFYTALAIREAEIRNICGKDYALSNKNVKPADMESNLPKYHNKIDESNIHIIEDIEADYKRRQGNLVLNLAKFIKPEFYERKRKIKPDDNSYKKSKGITNRFIDRSIKKFFHTFGMESELLERDFSHRLQDIEEEIERERKKKQNSSGDGNGSDGETK